MFIFYILICYNEHCYEKKKIELAEKGEIKINSSQIVTATDSFTLLQH